MSDTYFVWDGWDIQIQNQIFNYNFLYVHPNYIFKHFGEVRLKNASVVCMDPGFLQFSPLPLHSSNSI